MSICFYKDWVVRITCKHHICILCLIKLRKDECLICWRVLSGSLPIEFKRIMTIYENELDSKELNINNYEDFPSL